MEVIRCPNCNTNLSAVIPLYDYLFDKIKRDLKTTKAPNVNVENLSQTPDYKFELGNLLDLLHLKRICCRMNMLGKCEAII